MCHSSTDQIGFYCYDVCYQLAMQHSEKTVTAVVIVKLARQAINFFSHVTSGNLALVMVLIQILFVKFFSCLCSICK